MRIIILTGDELRHRFVRKAISVYPGIATIRSYCESLTGSLVDRVSQKQGASLQQRHLEARARSEEDFFGSFVALAPDQSNPVSIERNTINDYAEEISGLSPDILVAFGCSILREPLLARFPRKILNAHLGLSPYYKGGGTNFWPLVNGEPDMVGVTFMYVDAGIDTGEIIHQMRARIFPGDTPHQIGNRLIADMAPVYAKLVVSLPALSPRPQPIVEGRSYKMKDLTEQSVADLYANFESGMIDKYIESGKPSAPIVQQSVLI